MLIYDTFASYDDAARFARAVLQLDEDRVVILAMKRLDEAEQGMLCGDSAKLSTDLVHAVQIDYLFPFELTPPIVYVSRTEDPEATAEDELAELVVTHRGRFAGT
jgi:hypothetical protein